jgi:hypothetical protein
MVAGRTERRSVVGPEGRNVTAQDEVLGNIQL